MIIKTEIKIYKDLQVYKLNTRCVNEYKILIYLKLTTRTKSIKFFKTTTIQNKLNIPFLSNKILTLVSMTKRASALSVTNSYQFM